MAHSTTQETAAPSVMDIYHALKQGKGRELVNDANAEALIGLAREHGDTQLEYLLREWKSPCGDDPKLPDLGVGR